MLSRALVVFVGYEQTSGTTASNMRPLRVEGDQLPLGALANEMLANERSSAYQHDPAAMVTGLQRKSPVKLACAAKYAPTQLNAAASAPADVDGASGLSQEVILHHWLGGRVAGRGSTIAGSGSTTSTLDVASGHGARFSPGQMIVPYVAGVPQMPRQVTAIAGDTLTIYPSLSAAPAAGQAVLGSRTYHRAEAHTHTMTVAAANTETGTPEAQQRARMVRGQCAWTAEIGARAMLAFDGIAQAHDEGDLSLSYADVADDMGDDIVWSGGSYLWPSGTSTDPAHVCIEKLAVAVPNAWRERACLSGVEGAAGVVMTGGRTPATVEVTLPWDESGAEMVAAFDAGTTYALMAYATRGATTAQAWSGWFAPRLAFDARPTRVVQDGEVMVVCKFRCLANTTAAGSPLSDTSTDAERSPIVYFLI